MIEDIASAVTVATVCASCGFAIYSVPERANQAYCMNCARERAGITWDVWAKVGKWHPSVDYLKRDFSSMSDEMSPPVAVPFPRPAVTSNDPVPVYATQPDPVTSLKTFAEGAGWTVVLTYSEGYEPHAKLGTPSAKQKVKWVLRMVRGQERAVVIRTDSAWSSFWFWSPIQLMQRSAGLAGFKAVII